MPNKPSWLLRVNAVFEDLSGLELTPLPSLSRAALEKLFGLQRRQAIQIMLPVGGFQIGRCRLHGCASLADAGFSLMPD